MVTGASLNRGERAASFTRLEGELFDLAVIGGGITGAGIARDAALRGLPVALLEAQDYASGTSSRSSKMIHGGLRYLAQGDVALVRESASERQVLRRIAPHLARITPFVIPTTSLATQAKSSPCRVGTLPIWGPPTSFRKVSITGRRSVAPTSTIC
jgi:glycerol-3-phosphate dehydrogenase